MPDANKYSKNRGGLQSSVSLTGGERGPCKSHLAPVVVVTLFLNNACTGHGGLGEEVHAGVLPLRAGRLAKCTRYAHRLSLQPSHQKLKRMRCGSHWRKTNKQKKKC